MIKKLISLSIVSSLFIFVQGAVACPKIKKFIDYNCDKRIKVAFTGDSITYGRGDYIHDDQGGFVRRLRDQYKQENISFTNIGVPGFTSTLLLRGFKKNLNKPEEGVTKRRVRDADIIIIKVGVNDWWDDVPPAFVVTKIKRLVSFLRKRVPQLSKSKKPPFIAISTLIPAKRPLQNDFVQELNELLLKMSSKQLPVYIRSDGFPSTLIDESTVHPTPKGYNILKRIMASFLKNDLPQIIEDQNLLPDKDGDGVYDYYEKRKFGTSPKKVDTDDDGYSDKEEIFDMETDPLDPLSPPPETE